MSAIRNFIKEGRKIVAIGRNYSEHAKELGNAVPTSPFFFLKPTTSYVTTGQNVEIPAGVNLHHEGESGERLGTVLGLINSRTWYCHWQGRSRRRAF